MGELFRGFQDHRLPGDGVTLSALIAGSGPPLVLLHGFPQTRTCWHAVAPQLTDRFTVFCPDLRGYGRSDKPPGDPAHQTYSKRQMARDIVAMMAALGHKQFALAGHDRGGRVGYRLALDHPGVVTRLFLLDILPTAEMWRQMDAGRAHGSYHWLWLAQPAPLPETLLAGAPAAFLDHTLRTWAGPGFAFDPAALADYHACFADPAALHAQCEDYRAGFTTDRTDDEADRGVRRITCPTSLLCGAHYGVARRNLLAIWQDWAEMVDCHVLPTGHFLAEEAPEAVAEWLGKK
ncbi:MAG: alpha/beta hydrolase [Alphaproteobacteria bacterium]|nr:alpha/beta hydrolase [Alphaproteobacteria bacterium]